MKFELFDAIKHFIVLYRAIIKNKWGTIVTDSSIQFLLDPKRFDEQTRNISKEF